jgi:predicted SprT family Zn-dependent metalloprotease
MRQSELRALRIHNLDLFSDDPEEAFQSLVKGDNALPSVSQLNQLFEALNYKYFSGSLPTAKVEWSSRMMHAGKCVKSDRLIKLGTSYHTHYPEDIVDTLKHEMIHLKYMNHGPEFKAEAERIGASRYARRYPGMSRSMKYLYQCPSCGEIYPRRRRMRDHSCGCCSKGRYNPAYKLKLVRKLTIGEV